MKNEMMLVFDAIPSNESFARVVVAAFAARCNPTLEEIDDIKTAVSEAVTNAIIHGYDGYDEKEAATPRNDPKVTVSCTLEGKSLHIEVSDQGKGIADIEQAMEPLFTTRPELERSGMGFAFMEAFMDELQVFSTPGHGTKVSMVKNLDTDRSTGCED